MLFFLCTNFIQMPSGALLNGQISRNANLCLITIENKFPMYCFPDILKDIC